MTKLVLSLLLGWLFVPMFSRAHPPNAQYAIPSHEVTPTTQLWLTRLFIVERGMDRRWKDRREHTLLAYIVRERYLIRKKKNPDETFVDSIRAYSRGLQPDRTVLTQKMLWVRALQVPKTHLEGHHEIFDSAEQPEFWPENLDWTRHARFYGRAWISAGRWLHNRAGHPCPGALHWGMPGVDPTPRGMHILKCSKQFRNNIYGR